MAARGEQFSVGMKRETGHTARMAAWRFAAGCRRFARFAAVVADGATVARPADALRGSRHPPVAQDDGGGRSRAAAEADALAEQEEMDERLVVAALLEFSRQRPHRPAQTLEDANMPAAQQVGPPGDDEKPAVARLRLRSRKGPREVAHLLRLVARIQVVF